MSASYFNLLKYAATGQASPDMTYYDRMRASTLMGGATVKTLTGQPPLSFKSDGTPLISWSMKGNGSQQGTPTPDNPVMPEFVGTRTGNMFDINTTVYNAYINTQDSKWYIVTDVSKSIRIPVSSNTQYTLSISEPNAIFRIYETNIDNPVPSQRGTLLSQIVAGTNMNQYTFTTASDTKFIVFQSVGTSVDKWLNSLMLNLGSTALPYEPFGYKIPLTCAGQTVPVYLGTVQTVRKIGKCVLTGDESYSRYDADRHVFRVTNISAGISRLSSTEGICTHFERIGSQADLTDGQFSFGSSYIYFRIDSLLNNPDFIAYIQAQYAAGTPVTIWYVLATPETAIVNEPLCKISTYADELSSTDAGVTIPTAKGQNTLTVDTPIQPSEMTITYKG